MAARVAGNDHTGVAAARTHRESHRSCHVVLDDLDSNSMRCSCSLAAPGTKLLMNVRGRVAEHAAGRAANFVAVVNYSDAEAMPSRFGQLRVTTRSHYADNIQMRAAGFAEGYATAERIYDHWVNTEWWLSTHASDVSKVFNWCVP
jgi:hypothetical protein